ncbi:MAG: Sec-independent protein translocase protein TatC [bacterium]|nr:MAG: Sec-independent protein translocase protein TatC [bacterium]
MKDKDKELTFIEHLGELRKRIIYMMTATFIAAAICYHFSLQLLEFVIAPLLSALPPKSHIIFTGLTEAFWVRIEIALVAALIFVSPFNFYQLWAFISPGLKKLEKRFVIPFVLSSSILFITGAAFAYFAVFPIAFRFLISYGGSSLTALPSIKAYLSLVMKLILGFGLVFELPVATFFLAIFGIIDHKFMIKNFAYAILIIFVIAAVLTPPDVFSQFLMAVPLIILYLISIVIAKLVNKKKPEEKENDT